MDGILYGIEKIVVESEDGKDVIATIAEDGIDTAEGYRVRMKPTVAKHKLFISCPMSGRSESDIRKSFEKMQKVAEAYTGETLGLVNPYEPKVVNSDADAISCLADSIKLMANADYFIGIDEDWRFRGTEIEKNIARGYGLKIIPASFRWACPDVDERHTWLSVCGDE